MRSMIDSRRTMRNKQRWRCSYARSVKLLFSRMYPLFEKVIASIMEIKWVVA